MSINEMNQHHMCQPTADPCQLGAVTDKDKCEAVPTSSPGTTTKAGAVADRSAVLHVSWMALLVVPLGLGVIA